MKKGSNLISDHKVMFAFLVGLIAILGLVAYNSFEEDLSIQTFEKDINKVELTSSTDDISTIEKELSDTNLDNLDSELLTKIEAELN